MEKLYLVELIDYYYDGQTDDLNQETPVLLGLYKNSVDAKDRVKEEIEKYKRISKSEITVMVDEDLVDGCIESLDIVSEESRVSMVVTEVAIGSSENLVDYNRINYVFDYEKTSDIEVINEVE
ncbi:hypothetical protein [uncultured Clostridium sp.]|uniref:hypothetical protein n=1 Tax=uncultured Clostridium sp. TaxID=59620 RepID=UPI00260812EF|nr:hypothetical protein [uncultured Clostridium sp.]